MKIIATLLIATFAVPAWAQTHVQPHIRKDGTFVQGYVRSNPNGTDADNYGTRGNFNPYTGQAGTQRPSYEQPGYQAPLQQVPIQSPQCRILPSGQYVCR